jgi:hypothetical protein
VHKYCPQAYVPAVGTEPARARESRRERRNREQQREEKQRVLSQRSAAELRDFSTTQNWPAGPGRGPAQLSESWCLVVAVLSRGCFSSEEGGREGAYLKRERLRDSDLGTERE